VELRITNDHSLKLTIASDRSMDLSLTGRVEPAWRATPCSHDRRIWSAPQGRTLGASTPPRRNVDARSGLEAWPL